jgi:hypothetical protein
MAATFSNTSSSSGSTVTSSSGCRGTSSSSSAGAAVVATAAAAFGAGLTAGAAALDAGTAAAAWPCCAVAAVLGGCSFLLLGAMAGMGKGMGIGGITQPVLLFCIMPVGRSQT